MHGGPADPIDASTEQAGHETTEAIDRSLVSADHATHPAKGGTAESTHSAAPTMGQEAKATGHLELLAAILQGLTPEERIALVRMMVGNRGDHT